MNYPILCIVLRLYRAKKSNPPGGPALGLLFVFFLVEIGNQKPRKESIKTVKLRDSSPEAPTRFEKLASGQEESKKTNQT